MVDKGTSKGRIGGHRHGAWLNTVVFNSVHHYRDYYDWQSKAPVSKALKAASSGHNLFVKVDPTICMPGPRRRTHLVG